ncbi:extensin-like domain-containing protein [Variovorax ginsengisoli]|uniref:Extensin-like C-terminal domain-containing protein n=1 Tax=Variovorax ginsengisoli TaxID=363844 RepID=A0ABT9S357_9BURK|nr:extensin family protein [Variovorax ginsengisoli]MDP9898782.1 hypothetical protein [Variovorax ginsengisoli]
MPSPHPTEAPRRLPWRRWATLILLLLLAGTGMALYRGALTVPDRFNPWAPLDVQAPPDLLTGFKLSRARADPLRCMQALARTGMQFDVLPDRVTGPGCGFENAVRLRTAPVRLGTPLALSCPVALSFFLWERHALQPAAQAHFGERVASIDHLGSYACRNVNRGEGATPGASRSRHATANAVDIAAFTLTSGRRISLVRDWKAAETSPRVDSATNPPTDAAAGLLHDAHKGACRYFTGVLGPDYNAAHRDHFHLETGGYRMCR